MKKEKPKVVPPVVDEMQQKSEEYLLGWKKALADYDNLKKETEKQKKDLQSYALASFLRELLPVVQNFKQAATFIPEEQKNAPWCAGIMFIQKQLMQILEREGIKEIRTDGIFDPALHAVVGQEESDKPEGTILKETAAGYTLQEKVLIPANVIVATKKK